MELTQQGSVLTPQAKLPGGFLDLSPWDAFPYFQNPVETEIPIVINANAAQILNANPQRVAFLVTSNTNGIRLTTISGNPIGNGISILANEPFYIPFSIYGNLCQIAWFASGTVAGIQITVIETLMKDWPK